jgi:hypothetical protein
MASAFAISPTIWLILIYIGYWPLLCCVFVILRFWSIEQQQRENHTLYAETWSAWTKRRGSFIFLCTCLILYFLLSVNIWWLAQATNHDIRQMLDNIGIQSYDTDTDIIPLTQMNWFLSQITILFVSTVVYVAVQLFDHWYSSPYESVPSNVQSYSAIRVTRRSTKRK